MPSRIFSVSSSRTTTCRSFISNNSNWDQVIAGIPKVPEVSVLETLFFNQVKHSEAIAHDLQEYHRAEEGTNKKSYEFLVTAVRCGLDRERLESNRERVARNLGASASNAAPAVGEKTGYIPKGYCVKWNKGHALSIPARTSMRNLHQGRIVASQGPHQIEIDHHQGTRRERTERCKFAREDAALSASMLAGSVMNSLKNAANATTSVIPCLVVITVSRRD